MQDVKTAGYDLYFSDYLKGLSCSSTKRSAGKRLVYAHK